MFRLRVRHEIVNSCRVVADSLMLPSGDLSTQMTQQTLHLEQNQGICQGRGGNDL